MFIEQHRKCYGGGVDGRGVDPRVRQTLFLIALAQDEGPLILDIDYTQEEDIIIIINYMYQTYIYICVCVWYINYYHYIIII